MTERPNSPWAAGDDDDELLATSSWAGNDNVDELALGESLASARARPMPPTREASYGKWLTRQSTAVLRSSPQPSAGRSSPDRPHDEHDRMLKRRCPQCGGGGGISRLSTYFKEAAVPCLMCKSTGVVCKRKPPSLSPAAKDLLTAHVLYHLSVDGEYRNFWRKPNFDHLDRSYIFEQWARRPKLKSKKQPRSSCAESPASAGTVCAASPLSSRPASATCTVVASSVQQQHRPAPSKPSSPTVTFATSTSTSPAPHRSSTTGASPGRSTTWSTKEVDTKEEARRDGASLQSYGSRYAPEHRVPRPPPSRPRTSKPAWARPAPILRSSS